MGTTDLATNFDLVSATQPIVMSDQRDFERPQDFPISSTVSLDLNQAEDEDPFIKSVQQFMKNNPLGPSFSGSIDGKSSPELKNLLQRFELALQAKTGQSVIGTIVSGGSIKPQGFANALKLLKIQPKEEPKESKETKEELKENSPETKSEIKPDQVVKSFQSFLSQSHPIIGNPYKGPIDGIINPDLVSAAKEAESIIAKNINEPAVNGSLWNDKSKSFNTTTQDLEQAIDLINKQNLKKSSISNKTLRKLSFYELLKKI